MRTKQRLQRGDAGMALVMATVFIAVSLVTVAALTARHLQDRVDADQYESYNKDFDALEAAIQMSKNTLAHSATRSGTMGLENWTPVYNGNQLVLPSFDSSAVNPVSLPSESNGSNDVTACPPPKFIAYTVDWETDGRDNNNNGKVDGVLDPIERNKFTIYAAAEYKGIVRMAEVILGRYNVNVWQNAIFAGAGSVAGVIKGNVDVHGSVHILGDELIQGGVALEDAIDLSGTSLISNNYQNCPAYLEARVPPLPVVDVNGSPAETLDAKLRVKNGLVGLNGNAHIGQPYTVGSPDKQYMDATYVTDGWSGNKTTPDGGRGIPSDVYSDNGWSQPYDLGDQVEFPLLSDPWRDPNTGDTVSRGGNGALYSHEEYFSEVLLADPNNATDGIYVGNIALDVSLADKTGAFYWNATTGTKLTGTAAVTASPGVNDDYLKFVPSQKLLKMNGQIRINGTLSFSGKGNADTINYTGRAAFLTTGDVNIDTKLLTCNGGDINNYAMSYPAYNCLGIMTKTNIWLGYGNGASQLDIMGGFYAEQQITSQKQTNVMGTFVSKFFNITKNVPAIYQVPDLAIYLPMGMIGNWPNWTYGPISWREPGLELEPNAG